MADWSEPLETHLSTEEIYRQRLIAQRLADGETEYPDNTYEEGVLDTINWIVSLGIPPHWMKRCTDRMTRLTNEIRAARQDVGPSPP